MGAQVLGRAVQTESHLTKLGSHLTPDTTRNLAEEGVAKICLFLSCFGGIPDRRSWDAPNFAPCPSSDLHSGKDHTQKGAGRQRTRSCRDLGCQGARVLPLSLGQGSGDKEKAWE